MKGRILTTHVTRDNIKFSKEELDKCIEQINNGSRILPFNINHDTNRQIGFIVPGSAKLIQLNDGEFAVDALVNIYENVEEKLKYYVDVRQKEDEVEIDILKTKALRRDDTNCPTYWLSTDFFSLSGIKPNFDDEGLLILDDAKNLFQKGLLIKNDFILILNRFLRRGFSEPNSFNKRLIDKIREIKIRCPWLVISFSVIPNSVSLKKEFVESAEFDYAWGPKLPKDISSLKVGVTRHTVSDSDRIFENILYTDFWWHEYHNNLMALEIEEMRDSSCYLVKESNKLIPLKYCHSIYKKETGKIVHLDLSIRIYPEDLYKTRSEQNNISYSGKNSNEVKLLKIDGDMETKDAFDLISLFYYGNSDVRNYLDSGENSS